MSKANRLLANMTDGQLGVLYLMNQLERAILMGFKSHGGVHIFRTEQWYETLDLLAKAELLPYEDPERFCREMKEIHAGESAGGSGTDHAEKGETCVDDLLVRGASPGVVGTEGGGQAVKDHDERADGEVLSTHYRQEDADADAAARMTHGEPRPMVCSTPERLAAALHGESSKRICWGSNRPGGVPPIVEVMIPAGEIIRVCGVQIRLLNDVRAETLYQDLSLSDRASRTLVVPNPAHVPDNWKTYIVLGKSHGNAAASCSAISGADLSDEMKKSPLADSTSEAQTLNSAERVEENEPRSERSVSAANVKSAGDPPTRTSTEDNQ